MNASQDPERWVFEGDPPPYDELVALIRRGPAPPAAAAEPLGAGRAQRACLHAIGLYRRHVRHRLDRRCVFEPSCSEYARLAVIDHGALRGSWLAARRLLRCRPVHEGEIDYPPPRGGHHGVPHREHR